MGIYLIMIKNNMYFVSAGSFLKIFNFNINDNSVNLLKHSTHHRGNINIVILTKTSLHFILSIINF
jgi:hypothetical protein